MRLGLHAPNCRLKALECDMATSFSAHVTHVVVNRIVRGDKALGCKKYYVEKIYWLSMISIYVWSTMFGLTMTVRLCVM